MEIEIEIEIEIRAGFCDPDGELLAVLEHSDWRRVSIQRRGENVHDMVRVCDESRARDRRGVAKARRRLSAARGRLLATHEASLSV